MWNSEKEAGPNGFERPPLGKPDLTLDIMVALAVLLALAFVLVAVL
jgi:hypothetical protein